MNNPRYLITIIGPTAIGKTALAIKIATHFATEILSADSRQFFKEMTIGTAVPTQKELKKIPHHFIQHKSIHESYTVGDFERDAMLKLEELFQKKSTIVLTGGSGLYVDAVIKGLDDFPEVDPKIREQLNQKLNENGIKSLQQKLIELDSDYYKKVDLGNPHRLIRALEISIGTGKPYSSFLKNKSLKRNFTTIKIGLIADRAVIYDRINKRVDTMMESGLFKEAESLHPSKNLNALQTVGYKELFEYLDGNISLESAIEEIKKNTRRFAKRQLTWNRKDDTILWFDYNYPFEKIITAIQEKIR